MYDETTVQPAYEPPAGSYAVADHEPADRQRSRAMVVIGACVIALFALIGGALLAVHARQGTVAFSQTSANGALPGQSSTTLGSLPTGGDAAVSADSPVAVPAGQGNAAPSAPAAPAAPAPAAPAPVITSFHTPENIDCHNGNFQMFSASWSTTNAVKTTISIDGAGVYKTYGPNASDSLPFTCTSAHSFKLTAIGHDGKQVSKTITLQPRNVQKPPSNDDDPGQPTTPKSIPSGQPHS